MGVARDTDGSQRRAAERLESAAAFLSEHPSVAVDPEAEALLGAARVRAIRGEVDAGEGSPPSATRARRRIQAEFDGLIAEADALHRALPGWRWGITDLGTAPASFAVHAAIHPDATALALGVAVLVVVGAGLELAIGTLLYAVVCGLATLAAALSFALLHAGTLPPWTGSAGLAAGILGAALARSFQPAARLFSGSLLPVWLVLPVWLAADLLLVRELRVDAVAEVPLFAPAAAFGVGVVLSIFIGVAGVERRRVPKEEDAPTLVSNPILDRALEAREDGRWADAFELLQGAMQTSPRNRDMALAYWDISRELGRCEEAAPAALFVIEDALRSRKPAEAVRLWRELSESVADFPADAALRVRVGEALIDENEPQAAVAALAGALASGERLPSPLARRIVRMARERDAEVAGRAAQIALLDPHLDALDRKELQGLARASASTAPIAAPATPAPAPAAPSASAAPRAPEVAPEPAPAAAASAVAADDDIDPNALSADTLSFETAPDVSAEGVERWNDPGVVEDLSSEIEDDAATESLAAIDCELDVDTAVHLVEDDPPGLAADSEPTAARDIKLRVAAPVAVDDQGISLELESGKKMLLPFARIEALAAGAVRGLAERPVLVVDLVLNWSVPATEPLRVIRLRSDGFDPRPLAPDAKRPIDALRQFLSGIRDRSGATPLPDESSALGRPFAPFDALRRYEREVLRAESGS